MPYELLIIFVAAGVTMSLRVLPFFVLHGRKIDAKNKWIIGFDYAGCFIFGQIAFKAMFGHTDALLFNEAMFIKFIPIVVAFSSYMVTQSVFKSYVMGMLAFAFA